jgi:hypothetical protein
MLKSSLLFLLIYSCADNQFKCDTYNVIDNKIKVNIVSRNKSDLINVIIETELQKIRSTIYYDQIFLDSCLETIIIDFIQGETASCQVYFFYRTKKGLMAVVSYLDNDKDYHHIDKPSIFLKSKKRLKIQNDQSNNPNFIALIDLSNQEVKVSILNHDW